MLRRWRGAPIAGAGRRRRPVRILGVGRIGVRYVAPVLLGVVVGGSRVTAPHWVLMIGLSVGVAIHFVVLVPLQPRVVVVVVELLVASAATDRVWHKI